MAICLNTKSAYSIFQMLAQDTFFVDKSDIIEKLSARINTPNRYICITKPRRFGKTSVLNMLGAYYCKAYDSRSLFDGLKIARSAAYTAHLNKYNVVHLSMNSLPDNGKTYEDYMNLFKNAVRRDILEAYPKLKAQEFSNLSELFTATEDKFIFIIDEWGYIFSHELFREHQGDFLEYLRDLFKDRPYVELVYMTGVLPIKQYSTGSALNMFDEYTMLKDPFFAEYFGFTEDETEKLCQKQEAITLDEIRTWYNGYFIQKGAKIYNPRSVVLALMKFERAVKDDGFSYVAELQN